MNLKKYFFKIIKKISNIKSISKLIFKSCFVNRISSGIYIYYPILNKIIENLKFLIKIEIEKLNFNEIYLPLIQPKFLWNISKRYFDKNLNLFQIKNYILSPTNEEIINYFIKNNNLCLKDLPLNLYNLNLKFRNELRPNLNIFKTKEFLMKDGYSFCLNIYDLKKIYELTFIKYINIFNKLNLNFKILLKIDESMKSIYSHEFYTFFKIYYKNSKILKFNKFYLKKIYIPNIENLYIFKKYIKLKIENLKKKIIIISNLINNKIFFCFLYLKLNFINNFLFLKKYNIIFNNKILNKNELIKFFNLKINYINFFKKINFRILIDFSLKNFKKFLNINNKNYYYKLKKNFSKKKLIKKNIEIAHIFQIGNFYSKKFNLKIKDLDNKKKYLLMNSYGIGINRLLYSYINQNYDKYGIVWNNFINPYLAVICPIEYNKKFFIKNFSNKLYKELIKYKKDIILDDRNNKISDIIKDWDLLGIPHKIIISEKNLKKKIIEYINRKTFLKNFVKICNFKNFILKKFL